MKKREVVDMNKRDIGVALSGGGHRASLFTLGALLYLVDSGANKRIATISSVSGGSITNGFVAQECDFGNVTSEEFDQVAGNLASRICNETVISLSSWSVRAYLGTLILFVISISWLIWVATDIELEWKIIVVIALVVLLGLGFMLRGTLAAWLIGKAFFIDSEGRSTTLGGINNRSIGHVLCATDLTSGAPFYFFCGQEWSAYSPLYGKAYMAKFELGKAVRASAALPGVFTPKLLIPRHWKWAESFEGSPQKTRLPELMFLADGGVWNNLGTQYFGRDEEREAPFKYTKIEATKEISPNNDPGKLLIVDGSAVALPIKGWDMLVPFWGELRVLYRIMGLLYTNSVIPRLKHIKEYERVYWRWGDNFDRDWDIPKVCVSINFRDKPQASRISTGLDLPRSEHAEVIVARSKAWSDYTDHHIPKIVCPSVPGFPVFNELAPLCGSEGTHLSTIKRKEALALLVYGYICTMRAMHINYAAPLVKPFPKEKRFTKLVELNRTRFYESQFSN